MKKIFTISVLAFSMLLISLNQARAQSDFTVGGGLNYATWIEAVGIQGGVTYGFTDDITGAANFTLFFPGGYEFYEFNFNGHYDIVSQANVDVYGLAGLNLATSDVALGVSNSELGINLGAGAEFGIGFSNFYTELNYVLSDFNKLNIAAGFRVGI